VLDVRTVPSTAVIVSASTKDAASVLRDQPDFALLTEEVVDVQFPAATREHEINSFALRMVAESVVGQKVAVNRQLAVLVCVQLTVAGVVAP